MQVFSFKLRGAYNKMATLTPEQRDKGVICSSAGNHAQGVALAAYKLVCIAPKQHKALDNVLSFLHQMMVHT
jgi:threonine dehydratase